MLEVIYHCQLKIVNIDLFKNSIGMDLRAHPVHGKKDFEFYI